MKINPSEIHIWTLDLDVSDESRSEFYSYLNQEEREKIDRFVSEQLQNRNSVAQGCLRKILAQYLSIQPPEICFRKGEHGKPYLSSEQYQTFPLQFNLSHSKDKALVAIALNIEVGVDIESLSKKTDALGLAQRFFAAEEVAQIKAFPELQQREAFFRIWTRKEAYLKAIGKGLSFPLQDFVVSADEKTKAGLLSISHDAATAQTWMLTDGPEIQGFSTAIAAQGNFILVHKRLTNNEG